MEWRVYVIACAEALDKLAVLERRHDTRYQFEIEPVTY